jgi:protein-tyrosine phosphatase
MSVGSSATTGAGPASYEIVVVCTANICRSPVAELLLARSLGGAGGVRVSSAGVHARVGSPIDEEMARLIDGPVAGFAARQLTPEMIRAADLILVMTQGQRSAIVGSVPAAVRRTFTLREYADLAVLAQQPDIGLAGTSAADRLAALTRSAPRLRSLRAPGAVDDIDDPYGRGDQAHATAMAEIDRAVGDIVTAVDTRTGAERE